MTERFVFVPGIPAPQGSKRHVGNGRMVEMSRRVGPWRDTITHTVMAAGWHRTPILTAPVFVAATFYMPRPKHHYGTGRNASQLRANAPVWHTNQPDTDKLLRALFDALTNAGVWRDDSQVVEVVAQKRYPDVDGQPGCHIHLKALP